MLTLQQQQQLSLMFDLLKEVEYVRDSLPDPDLFEETNDNIYKTRYFYHVNSGEPTGFSRIDSDKVDFTENVYPGLEIDA
jgi:hypothetical protein